MLSNRFPCPDGIIPLSLWSARKPSTGLFFNSSGFIAAPLGEYLFMIFRLLDSPAVPRRGDSLQLLFALWVRVLLGRFLWGVFLTSLVLARFLAFLCAVFGPFWILLLLPVFVGQAFLISVPRVQSFLLLISVFQYFAANRCCTLFPSVDIQ